jgi:predicted metal-binding membrane protein
VSVNPVNLTYGTALATSQLSGNATWIVGGSTSTVAGTFTYTSAAGSVLNAGNGQIEAVTFSPTDSTDYTTVSTSVIVNVVQATPTVSVNPVNLTYGTALANSQLSGNATWIVGGSTSTVAGTFTYTSAAGSVLNAGNGPTEAVTFSPADSTDYTTASTTVIVNVGWATALVSVNPVNLTYGTALANSQLSGTATWIVGGNAVTVAGAFTYTSAAGTVLNAGTGQSEAVTFTPTDSTDYAPVQTRVTVNVAQADTSTKVTSSANPAVFGQQVVFTATVTNTSGAGVVSTGTVQFVLDGANYGAPVAVDATGHAVSAAVRFLAGASHTVKAIYSPSQNFLGSNGSLTQTVQTVAREPDPLNPTLTDLFVGGTAASNQAQIKLKNGQITVDLVDGNPPTTVPLAGLNALVVYGQGANDHIQVDKQLMLPTFLFAGNGANVHIEGGGGPTVEVGGSGGNDHLQAGTGRSILIAGQGGGHLQGSGGDDILIGGYTNFDNNLPALEAILAEWNSGDTYAVRTMALGFYFNTTTVHDDGIADLLEGGGGQDWVFALLSGPNQDKLGRIASNDTVVGIH